jgi:hypothetical protein
LNFSVFQSMKRNGWKYIATLDESWFYLSTDYESIWFPHDELPDISEKRFHLQKFFSSLSGTLMDFPSLVLFQKASNLIRTIISIKFLGH